MWPHFETYHVFQRPTYQAKYPPAQGLFLALGQRTGELPILGVWASLALACAATCWMLGAIVPRPWALLGGMLMATNPHMAGWWGQSYWGGAVAALGGALLFGALFRFQRRLCRGDAILMAVGLALLANSRPFEGAMSFLAASPMIALAIVGWVRRDEGTQLLWRFAVPVLAIVIPVAAFMLYYNHRLTGDAFVLPYLNWHPEASPIEVVRSYKGPRFVSFSGRLATLVDFFIAPPVLLLSLLGSWGVVRNAGTRFCLLVSIALVGIAVRFTDAFPHYLAPLTCLFFAIVVEGLRSMAGVRLRARAVGAVLVSVILVVCFAWDALYLGQLWRDGPMRGALPSPRHWDAPFEAPAMLRYQMTQKLSAQARKDLVLVRYESTRYTDRFEWVYNAPDIDAAEVVWARELSERENQQLLAYFKDRRVWRLDPEARPLRLESLR
jgi:hypothetical protein